ncbi:uncharacterized protein YbjQ (UPF0145 family) [Deinococcus metalli]|uniref:Uncharacterized protein YbjQ (UPF0145 family) n=1 Tax=Deinococcus metalli TaxID=1141878 RepID=A0A7W8KFT3_9DEIO|nr:heavy metal-binding domain-containing protein [Deinococcus metalli]MBB5376313.1 uncharacterized protein YbjQ (UPF0145 family) [Deinococcus metalli]GHF39233.1 hypothetical protein GCM10017781_14690 [Deinococcus metalli]
MAVSQETTLRLDENRRDLFTSDLSVSEFLLLEDLGYQPIGLAMGTSVYHLGVQNARWRQSVELDVLTQAMYSARHLAMTRMQEEARRAGATGIVGVQVSEHSRMWDNHVFEFLAVGPGIRRA